MSNLRKQMMQDLDLGGYSPRTKKTYIECIAMFAKFHRRSPAELGPAEIRAWVQQLIAQKKSSQRLRQHFAALRFLYGRTLGKPELVSFLSWPRDPERLPVVLSAEEVSRLAVDSSNFPDAALDTVTQDAPNPFWADCTLDPDGGGIDQQGQILCAALAAKLPPLPAQPPPVRCAPDGLYRDGGATGPNSPHHCTFWCDSSPYSGSEFQMACTDLGGSCTWGFIQYGSSLDGSVVSEEHYFMCEPK